MTNRYFCKITVDKNGNINWNINFLCGQYHLKDMITKFVSDQKIIMVKSTSIIVNCKIDTIRIIEVNEYLKYCKTEIKNISDDLKNYSDYQTDYQTDELNLEHEKNYISDIKNYYMVVLVINDDEYFLSDSNINLFDLVESIIIGKNLKNSKIKFNLFKNLKKVIFYTDPNDIIPNLPSNLIELKYYDETNEPIKQIPINLETLILGRCFDSYLNIPHESNLKNIVFPNNFSQPVDNLPSTLQIINFGYSFNHPVDNLPWNVKQIYFGNKFNHSVDNLPSSLKIISFDHEFNQPINNLPLGLEKIIIKSSQNQYCKFNQPLNNLPNSIEHIVLLNERYNKIINNFPKSLKKITILTKYAYSINQTTKNTNKFDIKDVLKKQKIECEIIID